MARWDEISRDNLAAAGELMRGGRYRSSVSRSYFAVYAAVTRSLADNRVIFPGDMVSPPHSQIANLVVNNLVQLPITKRRRLHRRVSLLRERRIEADYKPKPTVDEKIARECLREAVLGVRSLEIS